MEGKWNIRFYRPSGKTITATEIIFKGDGTFYQKEGNYKGTWGRAGRTICLTYNNNKNNIPDKKFRGKLNYSRTRFSGEVKHESYTGGGLKYEARKIVEEDDSSDEGKGRGKPVYSDESTESSSSEEAPRRGKSVYSDESTESSEQVKKKRYDSSESSSSEEAPRRRNSSSYESESSEPVSLSDYTDSDDDSSLEASNINPVVGRWCIQTESIKIYIDFKENKTFTHHNDESRHGTGTWKFYGKTLKLKYNKSRTFESIYGMINDDLKFTGHLKIWNDQIKCHGHKLESSDGHQSAGDLKGCDNCDTVNAHWRKRCESCGEPFEKKITEIEIVKQCLKNEVKFLLKNVYQWGELAVTKIEEIYEKNPELDKTPLYNSTGLTHFFDFFSLDELNQFIYKYFVWASENMDKIKDQDMRCKLVDKFLNHMKSKSWSLIQITKEDLRDVEWELWKIEKLVKWGSMPEDFQIEFDEDLVDKLIKKSTPKTILWFFNQSEYLETDKMIDIMIDIDRRWRYAEESDSYSHSEFDDEMVNTLIDIRKRLIELNKIYVLMENLKPHGVSAKLLTEHVEKEGRVY